MGNIMSSLGLRASDHSHAHMSGQEEQGGQRKRALPQRAGEKDVAVTIKAFETGRMVTASRTLVQDAQGSSMATSWRFLISHPRSNTNLWFDMGISHDLSVYPPAIQAVHAHFKPVPSTNSIESDTTNSGISPESIKHVIVSHAHWDHIAPMPASFTNANMIMGPGTTAVCSPGYPSSPNSKFDGKIFDSSIRKFPFTELPPTSDSTVWKPLGPFPHAYDFFSDGSLYLISAPGHMVGNMAALCRVRTKSGRNKWVLLGGDCAHCNLYTYWPEAPFGVMPTHLFKSGTLHECKDEARDIIRKIAECKRAEGEDLLVWYAHGDFLEGLWELE